MGASGPEQLALHAAARAALGDEEGDTLMAITAPANTELATREHTELAVATLRAEILERIDTVQWRIIATVVVSAILGALLG